MHETVIARFHKALLGSNIQAVDVTFSKSDSPEPKTTFHPFRTGFLKIHWLFEPRFQEIARFNAVAGAFDFEGASKEDTGKSGAELLKIVEKLTPAEQMPLLLKALAHLMSKDKTFARECGFYL